MAQDHWLLPDGVEEILPEEAQQLELLRRRLLDLFDSWGYELVIPPLIEFLESLLIGTGQDIDLQTFKLTDQVSGRMMGVRADMTPQVARIDAHNLKRDEPTRLCYLGTVLLTRGDHLEKSRSPMQIGAELYGHSGIESDLEILSLMLEMLGQAGLENVHVDIGHVGIFRGLAKQAMLTEEQEAELFDVLQRKATSELAKLLSQYSLSDDLVEMLAVLPELNGGSEVINIARTKLMKADKSVMEALDELEQMAEWIRLQMPECPLNIDLAELQGYHYHAGLVFAAFVPGYGREVARGGRYDNIGQEFGRSRAATGFSADLKTISRLAITEVAENSEKIFAPGYINDEQLESEIRKLRQQGRVVIRNLTGQESDAAAMGCDSALVKTGDDWLVVLVNK
ncbi:MAG: ATP phosphoribosyltransferase regulatory subunit [Gammaproteobacteria bacterium]|nr:MAG: ATP phosphoribosyltransferase regulatory subunit [Gammaproteobacteria bacterium]